MPRDQKREEKKADRKVFADAGRAVASAKAATSHGMLERAKKSIVRDIEKSGGIYPYAGGRLTAEELLRRAGLDRAHLQKKRHHTLRAEVNGWLRDVRKKMVVGRDVVRKAVTGRTDAADELADSLRQTWAEAEMEFVEQSAKLADLTRRCAELELEVQRLKACGGGP